LAEAEKIVKETPGAVMLGQFDNPANAMAHQRGTGPERWRDTDGQVDVFVAGVGTGGTLTGVGRALRAKKPGVELWAVEPADSPVLSGGAPGGHALQGIGAGFVPSILDQGLLNGVLRVTTAQAERAARDLARLEGALTGFSGGAALHAACEMLRRDAYAEKCVVTVLPDIG
jgi:cysteine synthase A